MRVLITGYDDKMAPIGDLTSTRMLAYAYRHHMDFRCIRSFPSGVPPYWHKMNLVRNAFDSGYREVMWLDADQVVTNFDVEHEFCPGFHASLDWGPDADDPSKFSMCGFIASSSTRPLFQWVLDNAQLFQHRDFPEQAPMRLLSLGSETGKLMHTHDRRVFNAVPKQVDPVWVDPWQPGDFCAHLTNLSVQRRVELFYEILKEAGQ